jgi:protease-4
MAEASFYGDALRSWGIDAELMNKGEYKSFAETFTRGDMSTAHREVMDAILDSIFQNFLRGIADGRKIDMDQARSIVDGGPYLSAAALQAKIIDHIGYRDELSTYLKIEQESDIFDSQKYWARKIKWWRPTLLRSKRWIAVLSMEGTIIPGEGRFRLMQTCGAEPAIRALDLLRQQRRIAGVVLHIDSRGGSAVASDRIWRAVSRLADAKPTVAYFGQVAASGGYYLAAPCHWIVAQPNTLTGSIGVVAGKLSIERLLDRFKIGTTMLIRGKAAAMNSIRRRYDEIGQERLQKEIDGLYRQFVSRVDSGRKIPKEQVEAVARGRVWTGADAVDRGLVDQLGNIAEAIEIAKSRARRRPKEQFDVIDIMPRAKRRGIVTWLRSFMGHDSILLEPCDLLNLLKQESAFFYAIDLPERNNLA